MKRFIPFFLIIFFAAGVLAQVGTLTVTNVDSEAGTGITVVDYEFTGDAGTYDISAEVSFNNGANYSPIPGADLTGQLTDVIPGTYSLTWDGNASFPETFSDETIVKITADFTWKCGDDITFTYRDVQVTYGSVSKTYTIDDADVTLCWLDRNLGATRVATASNDESAYGDLFQWGRLDDGHQARTSSTTPGPVNQDVPGHGNFITVNSSPWDWRSPQNNALWQGVDGINNPCPPGWRVPIEDELDAERLSWAPDNNSTGAFASDLKWPVGGSRLDDGALLNVGSAGYVWSSSVSGAAARRLYFDSGSASMDSYRRANGVSVRCVRDN